MRIKCVGEARNASSPTRMMQQMVQLGGEKSNERLQRRGCIPGMCAMFEENMYGTCNCKEELYISSKKLENTHEQRHCYGH